MVVLLIVSLQQKVEELQSRVTTLEVLQSRVTTLEARLERAYSSTNSFHSFAPPRSSSRFLSSAENITLDVILTTVNLPQPGVLPIDEDLLGYPCSGGLLRLLMSTEEAAPDILPTTVNLSEHGALPAYPAMSDYQAILEDFSGGSSQVSFVTEVVGSTNPDWTVLRYNSFDYSSSDLMNIVPNQSVRAKTTPCYFSAIFNFGDSNSDTGGLSTAFGQVDPPIGESYFGGPTGRYSDGQLRPGEFASNFSTRTGDIIRTIVPVHYKDWRQVPQNFRNDVWKNLMAEFELDIPPEVARPLLEKAWPQKFRTDKVALRAHLKSGVEGPPDGMDPIIWEKFVENERDPKKKKQNLQNSENRKQLTYSHTLGRCTYGLKVHQKEKADPTQTYNNRTDKWLMGHEDKNGCVLESAKLFYDKVKEAKEKRKSGEVSGSITENDELSEVFGKDPRGRVCGAGSHVTKKQMIHLGIAKAKENANKVDKEGINALKDEFKSYVQEAVKVVKLASEVGQLLKSGCSEHFGRVLSSLCKALMVHGVDLALAATYPGPCRGTPL
ncbi:hypothetical protein LguiA_014861 [Lonicera macranthoides]